MSLSLARAARRLPALFALCAMALLAACKDDPTSPLGDTPPPTESRAERLRFDCTGAARGIACRPSEGATGGASFSRIVGAPYVRLAQVDFDFGVVVPNQLRATVSVQNLTAQPFATLADWVTFDAVGAKVFFIDGIATTGGDAGAVALVNPDGTTGTFTGTNQAWYAYPEQIPANATNDGAKEWIFQLPGPTTTFSFSVYVEVAVPNEAVGLAPPARTFTSLGANGDGDHQCAIRTGGAAYCWGVNVFGHNGNGRLGFDSLPIGVLGVGRALTQVVQGYDHSCGLAANGRISCWGSNLSGQLGVLAHSGELSENEIPLLVPLPSGVTGFTSVAAGPHHTCAIATNARIYCWGDNYFGQLGTTANNVTGDPNPTAQQVPLPSGVTGFTAVSAAAYHTCGLANTGQVWCWGDNRFGQLADPSDVLIEDQPNPLPRAVPFPAGVTSFASLSAGGYHTCALTPAGGAWCWGLNAKGELGTVVGNNDAAAPVPELQEVPMPLGVSGFGMVAAGSFHTCAVANTGAVFCWGWNMFGQLGRATNMGVDIANPALEQVALPPDVSAFSIVAPALVHTCALATTGAIYCWGDNSSGQLGDGTWDLLESATPVRVVMP